MSTATLPRADRCSGDLMREAWALCDAGYQTGAVLTARVLLERCLRAITPEAFEGRGMARMALASVDAGTLSMPDANRVAKAANALNRVAHGRSVPDRQAAHRLLERVDALRGVLTK